jgi:hypothetical protein
MSQARASLIDLAATAERLGDTWLRRERLWRGAYYLLLILSSVLAAIAGATAVANVWNGTLAGVLALTASALTAVAAVLRPAVMSVGCAEKAAKYLAVARDAKRADEQAAPADWKRDAYYGLLERYDTIRTTPEPALPGDAYSAGVT